MAVTERDVYLSCHPPRSTMRSRWEKRRGRITGCCTIPVKALSPSQTLSSSHFWALCATGTLHQGPCALGGQVNEGQRNMAPFSTKKKPGTRIILQGAEHRIRNKCGCLTGCEALLLGAKVCCAEATTGGDPLPPSPLHPHNTQHLDAGLSTGSSG